MEDIKQLIKCYTTKKSADLLKICEISVLISYKIKINIVNFVMDYILVRKNKQNLSYSSKL